jgi:L-aminopeptidase/D-esterase-like protein
VARVPIVPAAILFDLGVGDPGARPGPDDGYRACADASDVVPEGSVGAGTGATVAKVHGPKGAIKGGVGTASRRVDGLVVGALAVVNAWGEVMGEDGDVLAGARGEPPDVPGEGPAGGWPGPVPGPTNTTLVVVATNARLAKERCHLLSLAAHEGLAGAVRPAHTMWDGDTAFALATGKADGDQRTLEAMTEESVAEAIRRAVLLADGIDGFPSVRELQP